MKQLMITGKLYDFLKWFAMVILPAFGTLYMALDEAWNLPHETAIVKTCVALGFFLGATLGFSNLNYLRSDARFDGTAYVHPQATDTNPDVKLKDPTKGKDEVLLKVETLDPKESGRLEFEG